MKRGTVFKNAGGLLAVLALLGAWPKRSPTLSYRRRTLDANHCGGCAPSLSHIFLLIFCRLA